MKQTKFILAGAVAALTLSSCSNNLDDNSSWGSDSQNVKFSSYIEGQKLTTVATSPLPLPTRPSFTQKALLTSLLTILTLPA